MKDKTEAEEKGREKFRDAYQAFSFFSPYNILSLVHPRHVFCHSFVCLSFLHTTFNALIIQTGREREEDNEESLGQNL